MCLGPLERGQRLRIEGDEVIGHQQAPRHELGPHRHLPAAGRHVGEPGRTEPRQVASHAAAEQVRREVDEHVAHRDRARPRRTSGRPRGGPGSAPGSPMCPGGSFSASSSAACHARCASSPIRASHRRRRTRRSASARAFRVILRAAAAGRCAPAVIDRVHIADHPGPRHVRADRARARRPRTARRSARR